MLGHFQSTVRGFDLHLRPKHLAFLGSPLELESSWQFALIDECFLLCKHIQFSRASPRGIIKSGVKIQHSPVQGSENFWDLIPGEIMLSQDGDVVVQGLFIGEIREIDIRFSISHGTQEKHPSSADLGDLSVTFSFDAPVDTSVEDSKIILVLPPAYRTSHLLSVSKPCSSTMEITPKNRVQLFQPIETNCSFIVKSLSGPDARIAIEVSLSNFSNRILGPNYKLDISVRLSGFGVPNSITQEDVVGRNIVGFELQTKSETLYSSDFTVASYTVDISTAIGNFIPNNAETPSTFVVTFSPSFVAGKSFLYVVTFPQDTDFIFQDPQNRKLLVSVSVKNSSSGRVTKMIVSGATLSSYHQALIYAQTNTDIAASDVVTISIHNVITPPTPSPPIIIRRSDVDFVLGILSPEEKLLAFSHIFRIEEIIPRQREMMLKTILVDTTLVTFSVYLSVPKHPLPSSGVRIRFSLPPEYVLESSSLVCGVRSYDGQLIRNERVSDDLPVAQVSTSQASLIDDGFESTQFGRHIIQVDIESETVEELNENALTRLGLVIHCSGGRPTRSEIPPNESFYIEVLEKSTTGQEYIPIVNGATIRATLLPSRAPELGQFVQYIHASNHAGDTNTLTMEVVGLSTDIGPEDVIEAAFPSTYQYSFMKLIDAPKEGSGVAEAEIDQASQTQYSYCLVYKRSIDSGERTPLPEEWYMVILSASTLRRSTHLYSAQFAEEETKDMSHVVSVRFMPEAPEGALKAGETLILECHNTGYPSEPTRKVSVSSVSLYRSKKENVVLGESDMMVDTLLSRVAYNEDIALNFLGPQRFSTFVFRVANPQLGAVSTIGIEISFPRTLTLSNEKDSIQLLVGMPDGWKLSSTSVCQLSIGSPYPEDVILSSRQTQELSISFSFKPEHKNLRSSEHLFLFCSDVVLPLSVDEPLQALEEKTTLSLQKEQRNGDRHRIEMGPTQISAQLIIRHSGKDRTVSCETDTAIIPLNIKEVPPTYQRVIKTKHSFVSPRAFSHHQVVLWQEAVGMGFSIRNPTKNIKIDSLVSSDQGSSHQKLYAVTIEAHFAPSQPWIDLEKKYESLEGNEAVHARRTFSATYPQGKYEYSLEMVDGEVHCYNAVQDRDETDIDCGGETCALCWVGQACLTSSDCLSNQCRNSICYDIASNTTLETQHAIWLLFMISLLAQLV